VYALAELVSIFAKEYREGHKNLPLSDLSLLNNDPNVISVRSSCPTPIRQHRDLSRHAHQLIITPLPKHAVGTGHRINADWLKRYFVHLRLTKKLLNLAADGRAVTTSTVFASQNITRSRRSLSVSSPQKRGVGSGLTASVDGFQISLRASGRVNSPNTMTSANVGNIRAESTPRGRTGDAGSVESISKSDFYDSSGPSPGTSQGPGVGGPVPWIDWLGSKIAYDKSTSEGKPKEFLQALSGRPSSLSKQDLNRILEGHRIIPEEQLQAEIIHKVHSWVLDTSGRRDFSHLLNIEMRKWEMKKKVELKASFEQQVAEGNKAASHKRVLSEDRELARGVLKKELMNAKTMELESAERTHAFVTKELYFKYDSICRDSNYTSTSTWEAWLLKYRETSVRKLKRFQELNKERGLQCGARASRKYSMAGLTEIEGKLNEAAKSLSTFHCIELKKSLVALRKAALSRGVGPRQGALVSKEEFDYHLENILAPRMTQLPENIKILASGIRQSYGDMILPKKDVASGGGYERNKVSKKIVIPGVEIEEKSSETEEREDKKERDFYGEADKTDEKMRLSKIEVRDNIFQWDEDRAVKRVIDLRDKNEGINHIPSF
jgi:hypothetical protein